MRFATLLFLIVAIVSAEQLKDDIACSFTNKDEIEKILDIKLQKGKIDKELNLPTTKYCGWKKPDMPLDEFSIYYYTDRYEKLENYAAFYDSSKEINTLKYKAVAIFAKDKKVYEFITYTKKNALSIHFKEGLKEGSKKYNMALQLLDKIAQKAP
jgi:hypothetical protein